MNTESTSLVEGFHRRDATLDPVRVPLGLLSPIVLTLGLIVGVAIRLGWLVGQVWEWAMSK